MTRCTKKLYRKALQIGKIEIDLNSEGWICHRIEYNSLRANFFTREWLLMILYFSNNRRIFEKQNLAKQQISH